MLFNSIEFGIYLPIVFILYWFVFKKRTQQNALIVAASYFFYGWWDWRFLLLMLFSSLVDYSVGNLLRKESNQNNRNLLLATSVVVNLGFLGFFKYYNFFVENFVEAFTLFGTQANFSTLNIILPVGISFYTFQTLSYTIDVYKKKLEPSKNIIEFFAFVSFFPQLVAGPIERATNLLPQFQNKRTFSQETASDGMRQILWGLFKKVVIADNCAPFANEIFANHATMSSAELILGAFFFTIQIYGDFSGYSDIAIGTAKLFGFKLMTNFKYPYFSRDVAEFWRRWHISLSTWFRDYLYIPLGGSRGGTWAKVRNTFIIFVVSGFWHGANWTFIAWGALNALYFLPLLLSNNNRNNLEVVALNKLFPSLKEFASIVFTFCLTMLAWIFFRAENIGHAFDYMLRILKFSSLKIEILGTQGYAVMIIIALSFVIEWLGRFHEHTLEVINLPKIVRWCFYLLLILLILGLKGSSQQFIYFQF